MVGVGMGVLRLRNLIISLQRVAQRQSKQEDKSKLIFLNLRDRRRVSLTLSPTRMPTSLQHPAISALDFCFRSGGLVSYARCINTVMKHCLLLRSHREASFCWNQRKLACWFCFPCGYIKIGCWIFYPLNYWVQDFCCCFALVFLGGVLVFFLSHHKNKHHLTKMLPLMEENPVVP